MTTIVMNTENGAVTEYDWVLQSVTQTHGASAAPAKPGLFALGADDDAGTALAPAPIEATWLAGETLHGNHVKKRLGPIYFGGGGSGEGLLRVVADGVEYSYKFPVRAMGVSEAKPGMGIRTNYIAVGRSNVDGADFMQDVVEIPFIESKSRKVT